MLNTIGQFFNAMEVKLRIYDLGRQIHEISPSIFQRVELQQSAYPSPYLQHAWLGFLFWHEDNKEQPLIWFVKLPLDEQGLLDIPQRDLFIQQLLLGAGNNLQSANKGAGFQEVLKNNPFIFTPTPEKQAYITSKARHQLQLDFSPHYQATLDYLNSDLSKWQDIALQGLADSVVNWKKHPELLSNAIINIPTLPLISLCQLLENEPVDDLLFNAVSLRIDKSIHDSHAETEVPALIRAISSAQDLPRRAQLILKLLKTPLSNNLELLTAIASRCHIDLLNHELRAELLLSISNQTQEVFNIIIEDLLFLPLLRHHLLDTLKDSEKYPQINRFFSNFIHTKKTNFN